MLRYYSIKEVQNLYGVSRYKAQRRLIDNGVIPERIVTKNSVPLYDVNDVRQTLADDAELARSRALDSGRRYRLTGLNLDDYVTLSDVLAMFPLSRQMVSQIKTVHVVTVWGIRWYNKRDLIDFGKRKAVSWAVRGKLDNAQEWLKALEQW